MSTDTEGPLEFTEAQVDFLLSEIEKPSNEDLPDVERDLTTELITLLEDAPAGDCPLLNDMQPPSTVIALAAKAAASVLMAFERGYRMG